MTDWEQLVYDVAASKNNANSYTLKAFTDTITDNGKLGMAHVKVVITAFRNVRIKHPSVSKGTKIFTDYMISENPSLQKMTRDQVGHIKALVPSAITSSDGKVYDYLQGKTVTLTDAIAQKAMGVSNTISSLTTESANRLSDTGAAIKSEVTGNGSVLPWYLNVSVLAPIAIGVFLLSLYKK